MSTQDALALRQKLESMVVRELTSELQQKKITGDRAKEIAQIFLQTVPEDISHEELLSVIAKLDDNISELAGVVLEILSQNDDSVKQNELEKVRGLINSYKTHGRR